MFQSVLRLKKFPPDWSSANGIKILSDGGFVKYPPPRPDAKVSFARAGSGIFPAHVAHRSDYRFSTISDLIVAKRSSSGWQDTLHDRILPSGSVMK